MLIDTEVPGFDIPAVAVVTVALAGAALIFAVEGFALRARRRPVVSGREELVGATGAVITVGADGAWAEIRGDRVRVAAVDGLWLTAVKET